MFSVASARIMTFLVKPTLPTGGDWQCRRDWPGGLRWLGRAVVRLRHWTLREVIDPLRAAEGVSRAFCLWPRHRAERVKRGRSHAQLFIDEHDRTSGGQRDRLAQRFAGVP